MDPWLKVSFNGLVKMGVEMHDHWFMRPVVYLLHHKGSNHYDGISKRSCKTMEFKVNHNYLLKSQVIGNGDPQVNMN